MSISTRYKILLILGLVFLILLVPTLLRWYYYQIPGIVGFPTYMHQRISGDMVSGDFNWYDNLSFGGREYTYPPGFSLTLAPFALLFGLEWGGVIMMSLFGALAAALFYLIAKELFPGKENIVLFVAVPLFIYMFTHLSTRSPPIVLGILVLYLFIKKKYWPASLPLGVTFLFSPEAGLVSMIIVSLYAFYSRETRNLFKVLPIAILIAIAWYVPFFAYNGLPSYNALHQDYVDRGYGMESLSFEKFFWETGFEGFPFVVYILAIAGVIYTRNNFVRTWFILIMLASLFLWRLFIYNLFPVMIVSSIGFVLLINKFGRYKNLVAAIIMAYVLFSGAAFVLEFAGSYPNSEQIKAFTWIKENTPEDAVVLSDWPHGHWIAGISERKNFMDGYAEYAPGADERMAGLKQFIENCTIPQAYGITHVFIEDWWIREMGIECVFDEFETVYNTDQMYVFEV